MKTRRKGLTAIAVTLIMAITVTMTAAASESKEQFRGSITEESLTENKITIFDALEILKALVNMQSVATQRITTGSGAGCPDPNACHGNKEVCDFNQDFVDNYGPEMEFMTAQIAMLDEKYHDAYTALTTLRELKEVGVCIECNEPLFEVYNKATEDLEAAKARIAEFELNPCADGCVTFCALQHCTTACIRPLEPCDQKHCTPGCAVPAADWWGDTSGDIPVDLPPDPNKPRPVLLRVTTVNLSDRSNSSLTIERNTDGTEKSISGSTSATGRARFEDRNGNAAGSSGAGATTNLRIRRGGTYVIGGSWNNGQIYIDARESREDAYLPPAHDNAAAARKLCICINCKGERPITCTHGSTVIKPADPLNPSNPERLSNCTPQANPECYMEVEFTPTGSLIEIPWQVPRRQRFQEPVTLFFRNQPNTRSTLLTSNNLAEGPAIFDRRSESVTIVLEDDSTLTLGDASGVVYRPITRLDDDGYPDDILPNATVYIRSSLTITGRGVMNLSGHYNHGIVARDNLTINGGRFNIYTNRGAMIRPYEQVQRVDNGGNPLVYPNGNPQYEWRRATEDIDSSKRGNALHGRDSVTINAGEFTIQAGNNGIRSDNIMETRRTSVTSQRFDNRYNSGFIAINGGRFFELHAPYGTAIRSAVPDITFTSINQFIFGEGGGTKIDNTRVQFDSIFDRQGNVEEDEEPVEPD